MDIPTLASDRLILRAYSSDDLDSFTRILNNRNVTRYLPRTEPWPTEVIEAWLLSSKKHWLKEGFGWWIVEHKMDQVAIGWCGLQRLEETGEIEVLYLLSEEYWGRGFATEAARMSIEYGFNIAGLDEIIGLVMEENIASKRVLEKVGLSFLDRAETFKTQCLRYKIRRIDYLGLE
jgi:RimJ/RimL family protein N-acetyltransferase